MPSVDRILTILAFLSANQGGLTLPELSRRLGAPKSSTHCLLLTMERRGYLLRNARTGRYSIGFKLYSLANVAINGVRLRELALPHLHDLMADCRLTVHMAIMNHDEALVVEKVEVPGAPRLATWVGQRMDLHCSAVGKSLMAYGPEDEMLRRLQDRGLPRYNDNTITSAKRLKQEIARIRMLGYSLDDEEGEIGHRCVGVPVFDPDGKVIAAVSVSGTVAQVSLERIEDLARRSKQASESITAALGAQGGRFASAAL